MDAGQDKSVPSAAGTRLPGAFQGRFRHFDRAVQGLAALSDQLSAFICGFLILATTVAMLVYQAGIAIAWLDDLLRMLLIWLVYLGTVSLCLHNDHITMDAAYLRMPAGMRRAVDIFVALLGIGLCGFVAWHGYGSFRQALEFGERLGSGDLPSWPQDLIIPVCFGMMSLAYVSHLVSVLRGREVRAPSEAERAAQL
jgi:TRAP-type C4-dicarboxylate transport system permease small subunit